MKFFVISLSCVCVRVCVLLVGKTGWLSVDSSVGSSVDDWQLAAGDLLQRECPTCHDGHKTIVYKRLTDGGQIDFKNLFLHQVTEPVMWLGRWLVMFLYTPKIQLNNETHVAFIKSH